MKALILAVAVGMSPVIAMSQEVIGTATGTVDGEPFEWFFTEMDGMSQSSFELMGPFVTVTLLGHPTPDTVMSTQNGIMLDWTMVDGEVPMGMEVGLRFMPEQSYMKGYADIDEQPVTLDVTTMEMVDDRYHVAGTASATLAWSDGPADPQDMDNTKDVAISFDVVLPLME